MIEELSLKQIDLLHWSFFARLSTLTFAQSRCCQGVIFLTCGASMTYVR